MAKAAGARVLRLTRNAGPGAARNHGAERADGTVLLFVDADVVVAPGAVHRVAAAFAGDPGLAACFGSYDDRPRAPGLVSRYRNLLHHFVHQDGNAEAATFWAGLGAVRRTIFLGVGGFDAVRFPRPSIEDIELGYRLRRAGHRIRLDKGLQGTHLKRWGLASMVRTDVTCRALPWARLILETANAPADLNLRGAQRLSAALALLALAAAVLAPLRPALVAAHRRRARRGGGDQPPVLRAPLAPRRRPARRRRVRPPSPLLPLQRGELRLCLGGIPPPASRVDERCRSARGWW